MDTIPSNVKLPEQTKLFINNEYVESLDGDTFEVIQPATEKVICRVSSAKAGDVDRAVAAAKKAFNAEWKTMGPMGRQKAIIKLAELVETHAEDLAILESYNNGQPIALARGLVNSYADQIRFFAGWCGKIDGRVPFISPNHHAYTVRQPIGVCGLILPWNVPLWTLMVKLIPCLAMGNTAVIKPAEQTPLTTLRFAELCKEAGIPAGVVNIVPGFGYSAGSAISQHMEISKVAFTGSTDVGRLVMKAAAESNLKKVQLELGGKSPLVIMPDADVDRAAQIAILALFTNNGQLCTAGSRTFVHESIYDRFVATAVELAKGIKVGDQLNPEFNQGPQVDLKQFKKILEYIEIGKTEAKLVHGGNRHGSTGFFIQPTIFADVTNNMRIAREEIFGPVMSIIKYSSDENLIEMCNDSPYGLAAGLVTNDISNVFEFANNIAAGTVWVNTYHEVLPQCEFGGCKQSGFGKEMGREGIDEWSQTKSVIISTTKVVNSKSKI